MDSHADTSNTSRKWLRRGAVVIGAAVALLPILLVRGCGHESPASAVKHGPILVPADLAREFDSRGIVDYCRKTLRHDDSYEGFFRGGHGTLWAGSGNAVDRAFLACEALSARKLDARLEGGRLTWKEGRVCTVVDFHGDAPPREIPENEFNGLGPALVLPPADRDSHEISAAFVLEGRDGTVRRVDQAPIPPGGAGRLAYWVEAFPVIRCGGRKRGYTMRVGPSDELRSGTLDGVRRASIELTLTFRAATTVLSRELFDEANAAPEVPGHASPRRGDLYAIVVAPGPFLPVAFEARAFLADPKARDASRLALLAVEYFVAADERTSLLAKETGVKVGWPEARVAIASVRGKKNGRRGLPSLDVLQDRVEATGDGARAFHTARGLANDLIATRVVHATVRRPVISASTVLSRHASFEPSTAERRIALMRAEGARLLADAPFGTRVGLRALPPHGAAPAAGRPWAPDTASCDLLVERGETGLVLVGARLDPAATDGWRHFTRDPKFRLQMKSAADLARTAEAILGARVAKRPDYRLELKAFPALPAGTLPLHERAVLTYRVETGGDRHRIAVIFRQSGGAIEADWLDVDTRRRGKVDGSWEEAVTGPEDRPEIKAVFGPAEEGESATSRQVLVGTAPTEVAVVSHKAAGCEVELHPLGGRALILSWKRGDRSLSLESVSPITRGFVVDAWSGLPVPGARVSRLDGRGHAAAASDGTFGVPSAPPLFRRLIVIVDLSEKMKYPLDPRSEGPEAAAGVSSRIGEARKAVAALLEHVPSGVEVGVWGYGQVPGRDESPDPASPRYTRVIAQFTHDLGRVRESVNRAAASGFTPLTGAMKLLSEQVATNVLSRDAIVLLLGSSPNSDTKATAAAEYLAGNSGVTVHCVGFAVEKNGKAEKELSDLAAAAGGWYRTVLDGEHLTRLFREFGKSLAEPRLRVTAPGYETAIAAIDEAHPGQEVRVELTPAGHSGFLTIRKENAGELARCTGLSVAARDWIAKRVETGEFAITLPLSRTNIGRVSAYAWFEREAASGRIRGVTEDGTRVSAAEEDPGEEGDGLGGDDDGEDEEVEAGEDSAWAGEPADAAFLAWMRDLTSYTADSVLSAMKWPEQPGFSTWTREDDVHFVQENALVNSRSWWASVCSGQPHEAESWDGVCLNFALASAALRAGTGNDAFAAWARSLRLRMNIEFADGTLDPGSEAAKALMQQRFSADWFRMLEAAKRHGRIDYAKEQEVEWTRLVESGIGYEERR